MSSQSPIDFLAREPHFLDHLAPTFRALPSELQGTFFVDAQLIGRARKLGLNAQTVSRLDGSESRLTVVASYRDLKLARSHRRRVVLSEHGAGQSYNEVKSNSYIGSPDRAGCVAVLVPGQIQADRHEQAHPTIKAYPVGCPKLDHHFQEGTTGKKGRVAISFHWDCKVCPETRSALRHYRGALKELSDNLDLVGHAHPRFARHLQTVYGKYGIPFVADFEDLISEAELLVIDNSSVLFEWASLDRPVVVMNAPWYRRDVEHGLRFWSHADVGLQVNEQTALLPTIQRALRDPIDIQQRREELISEVYAYRGDAAQAAVRALEEIHSHWG